MITSKSEVLIVGGGFVGLCAAAALAAEGHRVTVLEARAGTDPRFRGELIHAHGVRALASLGLDQVLERAGAWRATGFAVFTGAKDERILLGYPRGHGLAMDHHAMVAALREEISSRPGVCVKTGHRVTDVLRDGERVVGVRTSEGLEFRADLTVVADGRHSRLRPLLGLTESSTLLSFTAALKIDGISLPEAGRGHVFAAPMGPILAYQVGPSQVRMCVDVPQDRAKGSKQSLAQLLVGEYAPYVPEPLRSAMLAAITAGHVEMCANQAIRTERCYVQGAVLVGDSAGCSHPLSATGMTIGLHDVVTLARSLGAHTTQATALARYESERYAYSRAREVLAQALYDVFLAATPGAAVLREGMFRYWRIDERARTASMALLAGDDSRLRSFAREYVTVVGTAASALRDEGQGLGWRESMAYRASITASAWRVARKPLARSGEAGWLELLRRLGKRPAAAVPQANSAQTASSRRAQSAHVATPHATAHEPRRSPRPSR